MALSSRVKPPALTPGLGLDQFELGASCSLVVLPDLPAHAETQRHHVVLLTVPGVTALDVIQQGRLQRGILEEEEDQHQHQHQQQQVY